MNTQPPFSPALLTKGDHWLYETTCRKCGTADLRPWAERAVMSWSQFCRELMTSYGDGLVVHVCYRCGIPTVQDIVALSPNPAEKAATAAEATKQVEEARDAGLDTHEIAPTIYKYHLPIEAETKLSIPGGGGRVLLVADQGGRLTVWIEVDTKQPEEPRTFRVVGTGHNTERVKNDSHVGSAMVGAFVWHVFSERP